MADTKQVIDLMLELWNKGGSEAAKKIYSEEAKRIDPLQASSGRQGIEQYVSAVRSAYPDFRIEINHTIVEGDQLVVEWTCSGTHQSEFQGIPATGRRVQLPGVTIAQISDSKIVDERVYFDRFSMLEQLGVLSGVMQAGTNSATAS